MNNLMKVNFYKLVLFIDLLSFIKSDGSPLVKLIKLVVIIFSYLDDMAYEELCSFSG